MSDLSLSTPSPAAALASTPPPAASAPPPSLEALQALEASALDPMLTDPNNQPTTQDPLLALLEGGSSTSGDPLGSFNSMTGGDPLLNDLNNLDNAAASANPNDPVAAEDAALNQDLTTFLTQQATSRYSASQLLGGANAPSSGGTGALGNTTA